MAAYEILAEYSGREDKNKAKGLSGILTSITSKLFTKPADQKVLKVLMKLPFIPFKALDILAKCENFCDYA